MSYREPSPPCEVCEARRRAEEAQRNSIPTVWQSFVAIVREHWKPAMMLLAIVGGVMSGIYRLTAWETESNSEVTRACERSREATIVYTDEVERYIEWQKAHLAEREHERANTRRLEQRRDRAPHWREGVK